MIAIIDYGLGNVRSVYGAVQRLGYEPLITSDHEEISSAEKLILPGVGAFGDGIANLKERGLDVILTELVLRGKKPVLGICLGFQLMAQDSTEFGFHKGLGWLDASVDRIPAGENIRIPHVGWNDILVNRPHFLFDDIPQSALFYYVHSYHVHCNAPEIVIAECDYGKRLHVAVAQDNIYATQFHPEKSQQWGLQLLKNFLEKA